MKPVWPITTLGEVCRFLGGGTPSTTVEDYWRGDIPWVSPKDMKSEVVCDSIDHISENAIQSSAATLIPKGSILIVVRSGILKRTIPIALAGRTLTINQDLKALCPSEILASRFLYYLVKSRMEELLSIVSRGATVHRITTDRVRNLAFALPPLPEQHRIVRILDEAFAAIAKAKANTERNLQNAGALFTSELHDVFRRAWQAYNINSLASLCSVITDGDHLPPPKSKSGVPFITIGNVDKGTRTIDFSNTFLVPRSYFDNISQSRKPKRGDVLYTVTGSFGIPVLVTDHLEFCFQRHIALIRPTSNTASKWLSYLLLAPYVFKQACERATGTAQRTVSLSVLRTLSVPEVPLEEQITTADRLDELFRETKQLAQIAKRKLAALDQLKQSLLHQAFSGKF